MNKYLYYFAVTLFCCVSQNMLAFEKDGLAFNVIDGTETVKIVKKESNTYGDYVRIPEFISYAGKRFKVVEIANSAFYNCKGLRKIFIPYTIEKMEGAFKRSSIQEVEFDSLFCMNEIPPYCFYGSKLTCISIPPSVKAISEYAFGCCDNMTYINIPSTVQKIYQGAFEGGTREPFPMDNNVPITIEIEDNQDYLELDYSWPDYCPINHRKLTLILGRPLYYNNIRYSNFTNIREVIFKGYGSPIYFKADERTEKITIKRRIRPSNISGEQLKMVDKLTCKLYVPKDLVEMYETAPYWSEFQNIIGF